jgi:glycosyltransferase involved in cell wall biosynthesis
MNKKVIILFTSAFPYGKGEQFIETELMYLSKHFSKIFIFPYFYGGNSHIRIQIPQNVHVFDPFRNNAFNIKTLLYRGIINFKTLWPYLKDVILHPFILASPYHLSLWIRSTLNCRMILNDNRLNQCVRDHKDNLIFYFYWGNRPAGISAGFKKYKRPIIARFHRVDLYKELPINRNYIPFQELILGNLSKIVCISNHGASYLRSRFVRIEQKVFIHRLGTIDQGNSIYPNSEKLRIVSCSNIDENKRVYLIAQAVTLLDIPVEWIHIGDGPLMDHIKSYCSTIKKSNVQIILKGRMSNQDVHDFYRTSTVDVFVNVSENEGVPFSIMEALSHSFPVLATAAGGTPEIVDDTCGKLLPLDLTPETLCQHFIVFFSMFSDQKRLLRLNARKRWEERCSAENNYSEFVDFLNTL